MSNQLIIWIETGAVDVFSYTPEQLRDGCPPFEEIRRRMGVRPSTTLEVVRTRYHDKSVHMFVDEDGIFNRLPPNERASKLTGQRIVGPVAIWTGRGT